MTENENEKREESRQLKRDNIQFFFIIEINILFGSPSETYWQNLIFLSLKTTQFQSYDTIHILSLLSLTAYETQYYNLRRAHFSKRCKIVIVLNKHFISTDTQS